MFRDSIHEVDFLCFGVEGPLQPSDWQSMERVELRRFLDHKSCNSRSGSKLIHRSRFIDCGTTTLQSTRSSQAHVFVIVFVKLAFCIFIPASLSA
jgi:hypothetical protein